MAQVDVVVLDDDSRDRIRLGLFIQHERFTADVGLGSFCLGIDDDAASVNADTAALADGFGIDVARRMRRIVDDLGTRI